MNFSRLDISFDIFHSVFNEISRILYFVENNNLDNPYLRRYQKSGFNRIENRIINDFKSDTKNNCKIDYCFNIPIISETDKKAEKIINFCIMDNFKYDDNTIINYIKYPIFSNDPKYIFLFLPSNYKRLHVNTKIEIMKSFISVIIKDYKSDEDEDPYTDIIAEICANILYDNPKISDEMKSIIDEIMNSCIEDSEYYIKLKNESEFSAIISEYCNYVLKIDI